MTRTWQIARAYHGRRPHCGYSGHVIPDGELMVVRELGGTSGVRFDRCEFHAERAGLVPTDEERQDAIARDVETQERLAIEEAEKEAREKDVAAQLLNGPRRIARPRAPKAFSTIADVDLFDPKMAASGRDR